MTTTTASTPAAGAGAENAAAEKAAKAAIGSAYDIIKARLDEHGRVLGDKLDRVNARRVEVFGGTELAVLDNVRVRTQNNCVPRDIINVGGRLLFGYNVFIGLKKETHVEDVFALHAFEQNPDGTWHLDALPIQDDPQAGVVGHKDAAFLRDAGFVKDFTELYRYYKDCTLAQLRLTDHGRLLMVFQVGPAERDIKVLRFGVSAQGDVRYIDNSGLDDHVFPPTHSFEWIRATRENYVGGKHPHVNILDEVFVETMGGDLTIKVENNSQTGRGVYSEPVDDANQSLDDAQFFYARCDSLILLRILPYREQAFRHLVFNTRTKQAHRIDAIAHSCVELPEGHGIIFPGGFALATGEVKTFDFDATGLTFKRAIRSPNGEDVLYVFFQRQTGRRVLLSYNLINKEVQAPIHCHGHSLFDDGRLIAFRAEGEEPVRVHPMRIWKTPFCSAESAAQQHKDSSFKDTLLVKVGNPEAVRAISDGQTVRRMIGQQKPSMTVYEDLISFTTRVTDTYPWLGHADAYDVKSTLDEVKTTAELIIDEFQKVQEIERAAVAALQQAEVDHRALLSDVRPDSFSTIDPFVDLMGRLRVHRGRLVTLQEERGIDKARLIELEKETAEQLQTVQRAAGRFLQSEGALRPYADKHDAVVQATTELTRADAAKPLLEELAQATGGLQLLTEVAGQLQIDDAAARTKMLEDIAALLGTLNRARAVLDNKRKELLRTEGSAEFGAQIRLYGQAVESALSLCDTPERCDTELARLLVLLEDLEGRFAEFDAFLAELAQKREEVFEALSARKQALLDEKNRRAQNLLASANRILDGARRRALAMKSVDELNAAFAADPMIDKARAIAHELAALGDSVKAEDVRARLKAVRDDAARVLRDKTDIYVEGQDLIQLGRHRFTVNTQPVDLTLLPRARADGSMGLALHITGSDYFEDVDDEALLSFQDLWDEPLVSESKDTARVEALAASLFFAAERGDPGALSLPQLEALRLEPDDALLKHVSEVARTRYEEGYERGVHDADAAALLGALLQLNRQAGLLRHSGSARAHAALVYATAKDDDRAAWVARARATARLLAQFPDSAGARGRIEALAKDLGAAVRAALGDDALAVADENAAAAALVDEVGTAGEVRFVLSGEAQMLADALRAHLETSGQSAAFAADLDALRGSPREALSLATSWLRALLSRSQDPAVTRAALSVPEAAVHVVWGDALPRTPSAALSSLRVEGLLSNHANIQGGALELRLDAFLARLRAFWTVRVPRYQAFKKRRHDVIEAGRRRLRLDELRPRVLSSFVRNKLINDVYLPLVGDNFAKQMGAAGDTKRTDLMGLLLLVSPPGYGKTTLMEYLAQRLGLIYVKVNGPALGHEVTSLDPADAPNATARQEIEKLNLAFELGNNVMLLLDDIQHTSPELLQKFISLCDGSRRVEGVWRGRTRTYDLRGKKFCVVMAGNPYTESGETFRIPDMLANRADTYNLGDILGGHKDAFALSYIENALTSNATLQPLAARDPKDVYVLMKMARGEPAASSDLKHGYGGAELDEIVRVLQRMERAQQVLLKVNAQYIASAATDERNRTEPPFKLQGSYRNMAKLAEKIVAVMNDDELERLIDDHYRSEAQTLTAGAEQNLLKLAELRGRMSPEQRARWEDIKRGMARRALEGDSDDPAARVASTLSALSQRIADIGADLKGLGARAESDASSQGAVVIAQALSQAQEQITATLRALREDDRQLQQVRADAERARLDLERKRAPELAAAAPAWGQKLDQAIEALQALQVGIVVHTPAPSGVADLVRLQTTLIEATLLPMVKSLQASMDHERDNAARLEQALTTLRELEQKGVALSAEQREVHRPFKPKPQGTRKE